MIYEQRLPPRILGAGTTLICLVFGPLGIAPMPYVAIAPQPVPILATIGLSVLIFLWTFLVPEAGKYIPKLDEESVTSIETGNYIKTTQMQD